MGARELPKEYSKGHHRISRKKGIQYKPIALKMDGLEELRGILS